tara:strand:+ start:1146 stop:1352 length:207 start_codon:yes stop_codon:yes gene_type:complete
MMIFNYPTKKSLKESIGQPLEYTETSLFGAEFRSDGEFTGCNRPHLTGYKREFFASVRMKDGLIFKVA